MSSPKAIIWEEAPKMMGQDDPALLSHQRELWLSYRAAIDSDQPFAIIHFIHVIDFRFLPINDQGLGKHPYIKAGLKLYSFNEVLGSEETIKWKLLEARHWVVTFQDNTLDVIATDAKVVAKDVPAASPTAALIEFFQREIV